MWNAFLLVIALSLDSFLASLAYGGEHILSLIHIFPLFSCFQ